MCDRCNDSLDACGCCACGQCTIHQIESLKINIAVAEQAFSKQGCKGWEKHLEEMKLLLKNLEK